MDEVVMISEEMELRAESGTEMEEEMGETERNNDDNNNKKGGNSRGVVTWEKLLPRMMLRVLLVEADDSTRQIITALLRKCSYRVSAVPDGLKAWEILKGRPRNIDLILTEVDLPSISGFPLLTLIMEHEICKNIPVIMMSSQDSIRTVYQCMLRGAADYLVKPIRRNELRNLWQHVWRRQSLTFGVNDAQDESVAKQKAEASSEDNAASSRSSGHMVCVQRNNEHIEKGSDTQSSCTKPEFEAESAPMESMQEFSQPKWGKAIPIDTELQKDEVYIHLAQKLNMQESEARGSVVDACKDDNKTTLGKDVQPVRQRKDADISYEACDNNIVLTNSSREAIDLIGAFHDYPNCSSKGIGKFDSSPQLDLSLRRSYPSGFWNENTEEKRTLRHSNASAFTLYTNRPLQPPQPTLSNVCDQQKESNISTCYNSHTPSITPSTERSIVSLATGQSKESEIATSCSQQRIFPVPVQVKCRGYGSVLPPVFCTQSGPLPMPSPSSVAEHEPSFQMHAFYQSNLENNNFEQMNEPLGQNANSAANQTTHNQEHKLDSLEERAHISPATDQSETSSLCNGVVSHQNSTGYGSTCGSNSNIGRVAVVRAASESLNEEGFLTQNGSSHRSILREAALNKFRLKRKERCYDKKVRYESRKRLAEQRPRVKGQFVRHMHTDPSPVKANGNSFSGWLFNV